MSILVKYTDIALGARADFEVETGKSLPVSNKDLFKGNGDNFGRYDIPFELNSFLLDGKAQFLPEDNPAQLSFVGEQISNENGEFEYPIQFVLEAEGTYASSGITIIFDEQKNIYASRLNIEWYNGNTLLHSEEFFPTSANYFCNRNVNFYNKVIITFYSLNVPYSRLRVNFIEYGLSVQFKGNELKTAKIIQEIDAISTSVPINTFDFSIDSKKDIEFSFQTKQPVEVYFNDELKSTSFVKNAKRKSKTVWEINSEDYIGLMDTIPFSGGIYEDKNAKDLLADIFTLSKVPYNIDSVFDNLTVSGHIPYTTCREALMQVCFAIQAIADTSNSDKVNIFALSNEVTQDIQKSRIMQGQNFEDSTRVTAVELTAHAYNEISDTLVAYDAKKSGIGENIFVTFKEPLHTLSISNGTIIESGSNYAIINAMSECVLTGAKYEHTTTVYRKRNPLVLSTDIENIVAIENATLVSLNNVDNLLETCYNYIVNIEKTNAKIIDGKHVDYNGIVTYDQPTNVGDIINFETEYLGSKTGRIIKQAFGLNGGILVKDSVVR